MGPIDEGPGYAGYSVSNSGADTETAKCFIKVTDDSGDFGFDYLVGQTVVGPGQTVTGSIELNVGKGSFLINSGSVTNC